MALTYQDITAYTVDDVIPKATEVVFLNSPVFSRLYSRRKERFTGGLTIRRPIIYGELNGDAIGRGDGFSLDYVPTDTALQVNMKAYYVGVVLYGWDAMLNDGPAAVFNQVELKFQNASMTMAKKLAVNMYLNDVAPREKHLTGFDQWYDDGNDYPTIGGLTRSDLGVSAGTVGGMNAYTATLTSFTLQDLNRAYSNAYFGNEHVDLIPVTLNGWDLIWNATQPMQRFMDTNSDLAKIGFQTFRFNAAEVVVDRYMPTGTNGRMFGLNTNYIEWYFSQNPKFQFGFTGFKEAQGSLEVAGQWLVGCNIVCPNPRTGFKLKSTRF